jgi:hypothetical protein
MAITTNFAEAVGNCILRQASSGHLSKAEVFPVEQPSFYREVGILFHYESGSKLFVAVIQRKEGDACESHS